MSRKYDAVLNYLTTLPRFADGTGLERMRALCDALGHPEDTLSGRFLHVAGTNGKGSTCAYLDEILRRAGYRVGRFVSPYVLDFRERITLDGNMISREDLIFYGEKLRRVTEQLPFVPCAFEAVTAVALCYFADRNCDFVVWETGLGGRMDATNVVLPLLCIISHIDYDHTEILGDTLTAIAGEKAGILKEGRPVILAPCQPQEAAAVIRRIAGEKHAPLTCARCGTVVSMTPQDMVLDFAGRDYTLSMSGAYQAENAGSVVAALSVMAQMGYTVPEGAVREGFLRAHFPARFECLSPTPLILLDGAHNRDGLAALKTTLDQTLKGKKIAGICGMLRDKNPAQALSVIADPERFEYIDCFTPDSPRAMSGEELAAVFRRLGIPAEAVTPEQAAERARDRSIPTLCFGSLYGAAQMRELLLQDDTKKERK